jgi:hypothetical protein
LLLVLGAGICLGLYGFFGFDAVSWALEEQYKPTAAMIAGISAIWQFVRQPWWGSDY